MANSTVYALDAGGNKIETLTKEQILAAIQAAVETGQIPETLAAAIESIIEQNTSANIKFWVGTQAQFLELANTEENTLYFITDLTTVKDISSALDTLKQGLKDGSITVKKASEADKATEVTGKINGKNITDIFESNGTTAKKASEVTGKINGQNITNIFESDGTTAKKATTLRKYQHNVHIEYDINSGDGSTVLLGFAADIYFSFIDSTATSGGSLFSQSMLNKTFPASGVLWTYTDEENPAMLYNIIAVTVVLHDSIPTIQVTLDRTGGMVLSKEQPLSSEHCNIQSDTIINL